MAGWLSVTHLDRVVISSIPTGVAQLIEQRLIQSTRRRSTKPSTPRNDPVEWSDQETEPASTPIGNVLANDNESLYDRLQMFEMGDPINHSPNTTDKAQDIGLASHPFGVNSSGGALSVTGIVASVWNLGNLSVVSSNFGLSATESVCHYEISALIDLAFKF